MSTLLLVNTFKMTKAKTKAVILSEILKNNFEHSKNRQMSHLEQNTWLCPVLQSRHFRLSSQHSGQ